MRRTILSIGFLVCLGAGAAAQGVDPSPAGIDSSKWAPLPRTGVDFSAIDAFYRVADMLRADRSPSAEDWNAMIGTPGYRLVWQQNRAIRRNMEIAFKPSLARQRDSILARDGDDRLVLQHLQRAIDRRAAVLATCDALEKSIADSIARGVRAAAKYLPAGTTNRVPPPYIAFAIFGDDGYSVRGGVLLDPLYVDENGLVDLISHEFHHAYLSTVDRSVVNFGPAQSDAMLNSAVHSLRNEGIADQIDKPHPLPAREGALSWYPPRYNDVYEKTPAILKSFDSLLVAASNDTSQARAAGLISRRLLWSNAHPNGAYMAREIVETFGVDSLMPGVYNPYAFLRMYAAAERSHGRPSPWSGKAVAKLDDMERRYVVLRSKD